MHKHTCGCTHATKRNGNLAQIWFNDFIGFLIDMMKVTMVKGSLLLISVKLTVTQSDPSGANTPTVLDN